MHLLVLLLFSVSIEAEDAPLVDDTADMIVAQGLPCEFHEVKTSDGYILGVHRIPNPSATKAALLVHGLGANSGCWVTNMRNNTLAFMLYDAGYDVWLANLRGTVYSLKHEALTAHDAAFWDFSFTEFGMKDIPAIMDFMQRMNGMERVSLVGHSEGCADSLAMLSMLPHYASRVTVFLALAPAVFIPHTSEALRLADRLKLAVVLADIGVTHIGVGLLGKLLPSWFCSKAKTLCDVTLQAICGWDYSGLNKDRVGVYAAQGDSSSTHNLLHYCQCIDTAEFKMFDFGSATKNREAYGQPTPPVFPIGEVKTPMVVYYGGADALVAKQDVEELLLPALHAQQWHVPPRLLPQWNHLDPIMAWDALEDRRMLDDIESFN